MVVAETYYRDKPDGSRDWFNPADVEVVRDGKGRAASATLKADGEAVTAGGIEKMSKSKNNGVDPQDLIDRFGADTVRLFTMFAAPPDQSLEWSDEGVEGAHRFVRRLWGVAARHPGASGVVPADLADVQREARREIHGALRKALFDYERQQFNTVVSACMTMVNVLARLGDTPADRAVLDEGLGILLRLLSPIAPHVAHHLWRELGYGDDILDAGWPEVDEAALVQENVEYVVQVNGKLRARIRVAADADREAVEKLACEDADVRRFIGEAQIRKVIVVPGKLVNVVAK
jgi:leucyl-tRNA synthetase